MKQIYQLEKREYKELKKNASLTEKEIELRAEELYKKNGTHSIDLKVRIDENYEEKIVIVANAYYSDWEAKYPISYEQSKKVVKFIESKAEEMFYDKYDYFIYNVDKLKKEKKRYEKKIRHYNTITITGWAVAFLILLVVFLIR